MSEAVRAIISGAPFDAGTEEEDEANLFSRGGAGMGASASSGQGASGDSGYGERSDPLEVARAAIVSASQSRGVGHGGSVALGGAGHGQDPLQSVDVRLLAAELDVRARADEVDDEAATARARGGAAAAGTAAALVYAAAADAEGPGLTKVDVSGVALRKWLEAFERGIKSFASPVLYAEAKLKEAMMMVRQTATPVARNSSMQHNGQRSSIDE